MSSSLIRSFNMNPHRINQIFEGSDHLIILNSDRKFIKFNKLTEVHEDFCPELSDISSFLYHEGQISYIGFTSGLVIIVDSKFNTIKKLDGHQEEVIKIIFDKDTNSLFTFSEDCSVIKWDLNTFTNEQLYRNEGQILSAVHNSKLKLLISTCSESITYIYSLTEKKIIDQTQQENKSWSLETTENKPLLFQGLHDGSLIISELISPFKVLKKIQAHESRIKYIVKSEKKNLLFTCSFDQTVKIISLKSFEILAHFQDHTDWIRWGLVTKDDLSLYTGGDDGLLLCLDIKEFNEQEIADHPRLDNNEFNPQEIVDHPHCLMRKLLSPLIIGSILGSASMRNEKVFEFILNANKKAGNLILAPSALVIYCFSKKMNDMRKEVNESNNIFERSFQVLTGILAAPAIYIFISSIKRIIT